MMVVVVMVAMVLSMVLVWCGGGGDGDGDGWVRNTMAAATISTMVGCASSHQKKQRQLEG